MQTFLEAWLEKIWPTIEATYGRLLAERPLKPGERVCGDSVSK
jgi:hypothetical protein